ncbi:ABC transporter thiamine pyrophosphate-binding lipoprotein p37/Cypl [Mycoplasma sp. 1654_15]|uniref:ABC transporter thiamine pyrophosphate-binding lipoprotein p37/Cypl n=1 Tax=Mycoplasma sp. 1654_15 TaxID=2725994 RepID=UPI001448AB46|nr:DNA repair protein [Mycoplasma sp. 1654_15]QJB70976.1 DNA repair protein [Mycoplasma sp. 1654_15]
MLKKLKNLILFTSIFTPAIFAISCGNTDKNEKPTPTPDPGTPVETPTPIVSPADWDKTITIGISQAWLNKKQGDAFPNKEKIGSFLQNFKAEFDRLKNADENAKNYPDVNFIVSPVQDSTILLTNLQTDNKNLDFGISASGKLVEFLKTNPDVVTPALETTTNSFTFDKEKEKFYVDGSETDPLVKIAKEINKIFVDTPYANWTDEDHKWNGSVYQTLYDPSVQANFYRGMIWIKGDETTRTNIKKAWNEKNWETFRNYGILHGKDNSSSKFKLEETILKNHFQGKFTTLNEDRTAHPDKYKLKSADTLGEQENFHIAFSEEGSFAWTHNKAETKPFLTKDNEKIEALIVTNPISYDIGIFRKSVNKLEQDLIVQTFINLAKNKQDTYGPLLGYNGYKKINNFQRDIVEVYEKAIK